MKRAHADMAAARAPRILPPANFVDRAATLVRYRNDSHTARTQPSRLAAGQRFAPVTWGAPSDQPLREHLDWVAEAADRIFAEAFEIEIALDKVGECVRRAKACGPRF
jgi:hypothetical protein